jgi:hypothetical protein
MTEAIWVGGAHVQEVGARVIGQTVRARATVLRWSELIVEVDCDG